MNEWKECKLGDIANYTTGKLNSNAEEVNGKYPFFTCSPTTLRINSFAFDIEALILAGNNANGVFSLKYYNGKFNAYQRTYIITLKDIAENNYKFLFYSFKTQLSNLENISYGTATKFLTLSILNKIPILLPAFPEQKAIATVLSSLDDKIDLLHSQNKTLEAMAETLFRQWFVEEAGEEWEEGLLHDIVDFNPTYKLKKGDIAPYLEMGNVSTTSFSPTGWYERKFNSGMKFKNGDTLLARITPCLENGKKCFVDFLQNDQIGWGSTEYIVMRMKEGYSPFISYLIAKDRDFIDLAISSLSGSSGRQRAQITVIKEYDIKIPPLDIIKKLNHQLEAFIPKLKQNAIQIQTLTQLRDTLLPKLMSGEVRVKL